MTHYKPLTTSEKMSINRAKTWADQTRKPATLPKAPWEDDEESKEDISDDPHQ